MRKKTEKEEERKRLFEEKKKKALAAKEAKLAAQKAKEGKADGAEEEAKAEEEEKKEEEVKEEVKEEPEKPEVVELSEEEKKLWHKKQTMPDLSQAALAKYASFALPAQEEGFDEVRFVWQKQEECSKILTAWVHDRKMTQRVDDLTPGDWFKGQWTKWQKALQEWKKKQAEWKDPARRKAMLAKKKEEA